MAISPIHRHPLALALTAALGLSACDSPGGFDFDLRDTLGNALDTSQSVRGVVAQPPRPDNRGVVSYPDYQVAIARRGDTVRDVAARVGLPVDELSRFNGLPQDVTLRQGEVVALPRRVAEPSPTTGAVQSGPIRPAGTVTSRPLEDRASAAIARAETAGLPTGTQPTRHRVARGETAFSIARRYGVPVRALAQWNGLDADFTVREGSFLLIPVATEAPPGTQGVTAPGAGTRAPAPPSAVSPLPDEVATQDPPEGVPDAPDLGRQTAASGGGKFLSPVTGPIIRPYSKGRNDGIDISATPGTPVRAADGGTVAAITRDTDQIPILVLRHPGNILTVYAGVEGINVQKGDAVRRGQTVARVRDTDPSFLHFEVREGFDSVDPVSYLQ